MSGAHLRNEFSRFGHFLDERKDKFHDAVEDALRAEARGEFISARKVFEIGRSALNKATAEFRFREESKDAVGANPQDTVQISSAMQKLEDCQNGNFKICNDFVKGVKAAVADHETYLKGL